MTVLADFRAALAIAKKVRDEIKDRPPPRPSATTLIHAGGRCLEITREHRWPSVRERVDEPFPDRNSRTSPEAI